MWSKRAELRRSKYASVGFLHAFRQQTDPLSLYESGNAHSDSPLYAVYKAGAEALSYTEQVQEPTALRGDADSDLFSSSGTSAVATAPRLAKHELEAVHNVIERQVADESLALEEGMGMLATAVTTSPFLGLLGTVWGVMAAFGGMAASGSATLSAVAPGISGALLTTVVGLLVALPSSIGYNLLSSRIRYLQVQVDHFAQEFSCEIERILS